MCCDVSEAASLMGTPTRPYSRECSVRRPGAISPYVSCGNPKQHETGLMLICWSVLTRLLTPTVTSGFKGVKDTGTDLSAL